MTPRAAIIVFAWGLCLFCSLRAGADAIPEIVARAKQSVTEIVTFDEWHHLIGTGTGFFISPDGLAATNFHVIKGAWFLRARTLDGVQVHFQDRCTYRNPRTSRS